MPKIDNVGFGKFTATKLEIFRSIVGMHLAVTQAVLNNRPAYKQLYKYIDATAGKGYMFLKAHHQVAHLYFYMQFMKKNSSNFMKST